MPTAASQYVVLTGADLHAWTVDPNNPYTIGTRVHTRRTGIYTDAPLSGKVIGWARSRRAHTLYRETLDSEVLIDEEGPLVLIDETTERIEWWPGQSMGILEVEQGAE